MLRYSSITPTGGCWMCWTAVPRISWCSTCAKPRGRACSPGCRRSRPTCGRAMWRPLGRCWHRGTDHDRPLSRDEKLPGAFDGGTAGVAAALAPGGGESLEGDALAVADQPGELNGSGTGRVGGLGGALSAAGAIAGAAGPLARLV